MSYDNINVPQNVKYTVRAAMNKGKLARPLSEEEVATELYNLDNIYKRPSYAEQKKWLLENTLYFTGVDSEGAEGVDDLSRG